MKRNIGLGLLLAFLPIILFTLFIGCKKTATPLGANAPMGLDIPTTTPTPLAGAIEVFVNEQGTAMQGVTVYIISPAGVTLSPAMTQPSVGYASFNPANTQPGLWTAFVPSQSISFVANPNTLQAVSYQYSYFNSTQTFTVNSNGQGAVTFTTGGNTINLSPATASYNFIGSGNPQSIPLTATYTNNGNLNQPVSATVNKLNLGGFTLSPTSFIFGEGSNQVPITATWDGCYGLNIPVTLVATNFEGVALFTSFCTLSKNYSINLIVWTNFWYNSQQQNFYYIYLNTTNDCGTSWSWSITSNDNGLYNSSGGFVSGETDQTFEISQLHPTVSLTVSSYLGSFTTTFTGNQNSGVTLINTTF